jgi:hypothetical protein
MPLAKGFGYIYVPFGDHTEARNTIRYGGFKAHSARHLAQPQPTCVRMTGPDLRPLRCDELGRDVQWDWRSPAPDSMQDAVRALRNLSGHGAIPIPYCLDPIDREVLTLRHFRAA